MEKTEQNIQNHEKAAIDETDHGPFVEESDDSGDLQKPGYSYKLKPVGFPCPHCEGTLKWEAIKNLSPALDWSVSLLRNFSRQPICDKCGLIKAATI